MSSGSRARTHTQRVKLRSDSVLSSVRNRRATTGPSSPASPIASGSSRTHGGGSSRCSALAMAVRTAVRLGRRGVTVNDGDVSKSEAMAKPRLGLAIGSGSDHRPRLFSDLLWAICSPWTEFDAPRPASDRLCAICSAPAAGACPGKDVRHVALDGLARQKQPARYLGIAVPGADEGRDLALALTEPVERTFSSSGLAAPPGADAETAQPKLCQMLLGGRTYGGRFVTGFSKLLCCTPPIAPDQRAGKVQSGPQQCADQAKSVPLRQDRFDLCNAGGVAPGDRDQGRHVPPPEHVVQQCGTPILVPGLQRFLRLFEAAQTR